jgi:hypothetical protein
MEGPGADFHVIGLQDHAAFFRPKALKREDQPLERTPGIHLGLRRGGLVGGVHGAGLSAARMGVKPRLERPFVNGAEAPDTKH